MKLTWCHPSNAKHHQTLLYIHPSNISYPHPFPIAKPNTTILYPPHDPNENTWSFRNWEDQYRERCIFKDIQQCACKTYISCHPHWATSSQSPSSLPMDLPPTSPHVLPPSSVCLPPSPGLTICILWVGMYVMGIRRWAQNAEYSLMILQLSMPMRLDDTLQSPNPLLHCPPTPHIPFHNYNLMDLTVPSYCTRPINFLYCLSTLYTRVVWMDGIATHGKWRCIWDGFIREGWDWGGKWS